MNDSHFFPVHRHSVLLRPRLVDLALANDPALIVLRGGGGSGKSMVAAQIAAAFLARNAADATRIDAVWVRFDEDDAGVDGVWQRIFDTLHESGLIRPGGLAERIFKGGVSTIDPRTAAQSLADHQNRLFLVLDDIHVVFDDKTALSVIRALESSPSLTVLVTSRRAHPHLVSPNARLSLPLIELDGAELAMTQAEVAALVELRAPTLDPAQQETLTEQISTASRGWPLAAQALIVQRDGLGRTGLPALPSPARHSAFVRSLVTRQLESSPRETREVLYVSALFDEVSVEAVASMLELPAARVEAILDDNLEASFEYWSDDEGTRWYRHHELLRVEFAERATAQLGQERLYAVYTRAANAFREVRVQQAVVGAIRSEQWELLSELLVRRIVTSIIRRKPRLSLSVVPTAVREQHPIIEAFALIEEYAHPSGRIGQVFNGFKILAGRALATESEKSGINGAVAAALRMVAARLIGNEDLALRMVARIRDILPQLGPKELEALGSPLQISCTQSAITLLHAGFFVEAELVLHPLRATPHLVIPSSTAHSLALTAWSCAWRGDMPAARTLITEGRETDIPVAWENSYIGTGYRIAAALDHLERGDTDGAATQLDALSEHLETIEHWPYLVAIDALIVESRLGPGEALHRLNAHVARRRGPSTLFDSSRRVLSELKARLQWQSGQVTSARKRLVGNDLEAVYAALGRGEPLVAGAIAVGLEQREVSASLPRERTIYLLLQAECARRSGDLEGAKVAASKASRLMQEFALTLPMRAITRDSAEALAQLAPGLPVESSLPGTVREITPLTPAEHRTLINVIEHGSVTAAAAAMFVSAETAKSQLKQVYRKLGVKNRAEATRYAGGAGLLVPGREERDAT